MRIRGLFVLGIALLLIAAPLAAQPPSGSGKAKSPRSAASKDAKKESREADLAAIRQGSQEFVAAFNGGNAKAVAALWTEDGDYTADSGEVFSGRAAIEKQYQAVLSANKGLRLKLVIDSLRLLSDSAAIEDGRAFLEPAPVGPPAISKYTVVHVKVDGKWLMSTVRDTRIETSSNYRKVEDLEWLIGKWVAEDNGVTTESECRWVANKSFVERSYTATHPDGTTSSGVQIIGFNPQGGHVQSWNFSSDGGHALGVWSARENGWSADIRGTLADGTSTTATNLLTRLDDNAYTWQSVDRTAGDDKLPDTDEVVIKRQTK